jgi:hypothetical protein
MISSPADLIERARSVAGLQDLGSDHWVPGFERLLGAVDAEVDDVAAVDRIETIVVGRLVQRLRIESWYAAHGPEAAHPVEAPIVVFGLPRTATTAVHHLLAIDSQFRVLRSWEVDDPVPPPDLATEHCDARRPKETQQDVRHIVAIDGPAEDWPIHAMAFDHGELTLPVPAYSAWWRGRDHTGLFDYHERVLRLLHSHRPPRRWLLKLPAYLFLLPQLAAHYPKTTFVMTHRHPAIALASACSTVAASRQKRTPSWEVGPRFGREQLEHWADGMGRAMAARAEIGDHRFVDVAQHDVERDPVGVAERVYSAAGVELDGRTVDAMRAWADANRPGSRGQHRYSLAAYGLTAAEVDDAFGPYLDRHGDLCPAASDT